MRILIIGAGGHAQVTADILWQMQGHDPTVEPIGYLDDNPALQGKQFIGLPVLGQLADFTTIAHDALIVAIGDNAVRRHLFLRFQSLQASFAIACHPHAVVARDVKIGAGAMICAGVIINSGSVIGENVILNTACSVDHHNQVNDHAHLAPGCHLGGDVIVGEGALIGVGAAVLPQRRIGAWSVVGAGAAVIRDLPEHIVAVGVPTRILRDIDTGALSVE